MLCIFSRAYWLSVFLWRNVFIHSSEYFRSSASFLIGLFHYCWVVWLVCIFRRLSPYCLHDLQIFSPVLYKVTFSLTYGFLCCEHCFFDHIPLHRTQDFHAQSKSSSRSHRLLSSRPGPVCTIFFGLGVAIIAIGVSGVGSSRHMHMPGCRTGKTKGWIGWRSRSAHQLSPSWSERLIS